MQNLTSAEEADWHRRCARQREIARTAPCFHPGQTLMECYRFHLGPWNFVLIVSRFTNPPQWQGTVSLFKEIGEERVTDEGGKYIFDAPQVGMVSVHSWTKEDFDIARSLLSDVFGPLIHGEHQQAVEMKGQMTMMWATAEADAETLDS